MSEITIRPADGWTSVTASGYEVKVTGESAIALDIEDTGVCLLVSSSWHSDGELWTRYVDATSGGPDVIVRVGRGYVIWLRRR